MKNINGTPVLVRHLADVHESCLPRLGQVGRMEEDDVVQGIIVMRKGENPGEVIAALKHKIAELNTGILPEDVEILSLIHILMVVGTSTRMFCLEMAPVSLQSICMGFMFRKEYP